MFIMTAKVLGIILIVSGLCVFDVSGVPVVGEIKSSFKTNTIPENKEAVFTIDATCVGTCKYSWTVTGLKTASTTTFTVAFPRPTSGTQYTVSCTVSGYNTTAPTKTLTIDVIFGPDTPVFGVGVATPYVVNEGNTTAFDTITCRLSRPCNPACTITWTKAGTTTVLNGDIGTPVKLFKAVPNDYRGSTGIYTCTAKNGQTNNTKMINLDLTVQYPPDVNIAWYVATKTITCSADGNPATYKTFNIYQMFADKMIRSLNSTQKGNILSYTFSSTSYQDSGSYVCKVSNTIKNLETQLDYEKSVTFINITAPPLLLDYSNSFNISKGNPLNWVFPLYANPLVKKVSIVKDTVPINPTMFRFPQADVTLNIHGVSVTTSNGDGGQNVFYTVDELDDHHFGEYSIIVSNNMGNDSRNITLFPKGPPDTPVDFKITSVAHDSVTLTFVSGFYNGAEQHFVVEKKRGKNNSTTWKVGYNRTGGIKTGQRLSVRIKCQPSTFYKFRSFAFNIHNSSPYTLQVNATTLPMPSNKGAIIGGVVGSLLAVIVIVLVIVYCCWKKRKAKKIQRLPSKIPFADITQQRESNAYGNVPTSISHENTAAQSDLYENVPSAKKSTAELSRETTTSTPVINDTNSENDNLARLQPLTDDRAANGEDLFVQDGYLELTGDTPDTVEEAYTTKHGYQNTNQSNHKAEVEEAYLPMEFSAIPKNSNPTTAKTVHEETQEDLYLNMDEQQRSRTNTGISNKSQPRVSNKGVLDAAEADDNYLDMDTITANVKSKSQDNKLPEDYQNCTDFKKPSPKVAKQEADDMYLDMETAKINTHMKPPVAAIKPTVRYTKQDSLDEYINVEQMKAKLPPPKSPKPKLAQKKDRESIPEYTAPAPPVQRQQMIEEDPYMNVNIEKR